MVLIPAPPIMRPTMTLGTLRALAPALLMLCVLAVSRPAIAQDAVRPAAKAPVRMAQMSAPDLIVRLDQLENQIRHLTGAIEQLQFRNQQLEQAMRRMQEDADFRFQELGSKGGARPAAQAQPQPRTTPLVQPGLPAPVPQPAVPARRSDVFDPTQNPGAPGAPRQLGSMAVPGGAPPIGGPAVNIPQGGPIVSDEPPIGAPGGRAVGAPLDLSTLAGHASNEPSAPSGYPQADPGGTLPPPPPRNPNATGGHMAAVSPPSQMPKDEYDLGYGYMLRKDYALAEDTFRGFLRKFPSDRLAPDAQYWLGESLFQRQRFRDSAEAFLTVTTKYETTAKAPEALLRLGQSLAALGEREAGCAALGEITRKYPRASLSVKQGVEREQKRARC
jgi:tol-pal system protein YbgF